MIKIQRTKSLLIIIYHVFRQNVCIIRVRNVQYLLFNYTTDQCQSVKVWAPIRKISYCFKRYAEQLKLVYSGWTLNWSIFLCFQNNKWWFKITELSKKYNLNLSCIILYSFILRTLLFFHRFCCSNLLLYNSSMHKG